VPKEKKGRLENLLIELEGGLVKVTKYLKAGKLAILDYEVIGSDRAKTISHVKCTLFTGRKHQIRVQMAALGHKVLGDPVYGKGNEPPGRLALHAATLAFVHPRTRREVRFSSPMPGGFVHLVR
jgi:23S rRNA pseudouridine1911/1915/1917 synthase